jgi:hypothetical protein
MRSFGLALQEDGGSKEVTLHNTYMGRPSQREQNPSVMYRLQILGLATTSAVHWAPTWISSRCNTLTSWMALL